MKGKFKTDYEKFAGASQENRKLLRQEELILEATEGLASLMVRQGVSKAELARRLGRTRGYITQILAGSRNFTLRTLAEVANALGYRVRLSFDADPVAREAAKARQDAAPSVAVIEQAAQAGRG